MSSLRKFKTAGKAVLMGVKMSKIKYNTKRAKKLALKEQDLEEYKKQKAEKKAK
jgi:hypothetical protein